MSLAAEIAKEKVRMKLSTKCFDDRLKNQRAVKRVECDTKGEPSRIETSHFWINIVDGPSVKVPFVEVFGRTGYVAEHDSHLPTCSEPVIILIKRCLP